MQRREFITIIGVAAAAIPMTALAQRSETAVVDVLNPDGPKSDYVKGRGEYKAREGGRHLNAKLKPRTFNERFS
jgi:hypothetical protein